MNSGFWTNNPCVPRWSDTISQLWSGSPPRLLEPTPAKRPVRVPAGCKIRLAVAEDSGAIAEFWGRYFSISRSCRCAVSKEIVLRSIASARWQIVVVVSGDQIIGTVVRRYLKGLHVYEARWAAAAAIDFFCVHPNWRSRGVGRCLLDTVHNLSALPLQPHLIFWEGLRPSVPPLAGGFFWARRTASDGAQSATLVRDKEEIQKAWANCVKGCDVWTEEPGDEISVWNCGGRHVVVWNTLHVTVPDGKPIGIVLSDLESASALAGMKSYWGVLLTPQSSPLAQGEWFFDSVYQWIGYNLSVGKPSLQFPRIGF
jgi:hypothetical protein